MKKTICATLAVLLVAAAGISLTGCNAAIGNQKAKDSYEQLHVTFPLSDAERTELNRAIFEITPFEISFQLPKGWNIGNYDAETGYLYNGAWSRVGLYDAEENCIGAVGYNVYEPNEAITDEPMSIYSQIALGNDYQFNVHETYTVVKKTDQHQTAMVDVYYAPSFTDKAGEDDATNYGILSQSLKQAVYVAFELAHKALTSEEVAEIANSIEFK